MGDRSLVLLDGGSVSRSVLSRRIGLGCRSRLLLCIVYLLEDPFVLQSIQREYLQSYQSELRIVTWTFLDRNWLVSEGQSRRGNSR